MMGLIVIDWSMVELVAFIVLFAIGVFMFIVDTWI